MNDTSNRRTRFHLAIPVDSIEDARAFYGGLLQCPEGRSAETWVDFDLYGHQLVVHLVSASSTGSPASNPVDGHSVPVPHFGVLLAPTEWSQLAVRLEEARTDFIIEPHTRFEGEVGEQSTMFLLDPAGNALEFKSFVDDDQVFAS